MTFRFLVLSEKALLRWYDIIKYKIIIVKSQTVESCLISRNDFDCVL